MLDYTEIKKIKAIYENGGNIIQYTKANTSLPAEEVIMFSYDLQAGSYIKALQENNLQALKQKVGEKLASLFKDLAVETICEAGVGEATTLAHVLEHVSIPHVYAFDISLSRLLYAKSFMQDKGQTAALFCSELNRIPFPDNSIDCIYSYHSLEPNGGSEQMMLQELLRVAKRYLILIEPDFDMFDDEQRERMTKLGYIRHLHKHLQDLNAHILYYDAWDLDSNPQNKASIIIVEKKNKRDVVKVEYISPVSHEPLLRVPEGWYCQHDGFLFPVVNGIPIFLKKYAILASHYHHFYKSL